MKSGELLETEESPQDDSRIRLSQLKDFASGQGTKITPEDQRQNFKSRMTGFLAIGVWSLLAGVVIWQISFIGILCNKEIPKGSSASAGDQKELLDKKSTLINETAKTLYTFLGPLITAATGFYFASSESKKSED
jgi:hypothetical protein